MMGSKFAPETGAPIHPHQQQQQQQQHQQQQQLHLLQNQHQPVHQELRPSLASEENRQYLKVFIQTYRNLPILWDTTLRDYSNRDKRAEAYEQLVPIYRFLKRDANLLDVKKKINTLRTNYRKELKMIEMARKQGNVYNPRCWTFYDLDFLRNAEKFLAVDPNHSIKTEPSTNSSPPSQFTMFNEPAHQDSFLEISPFGLRMNNGASPPPNITQMFQKSFGQTNNLADKPTKSQAPSSLQTPPLERQEVAASQGHNSHMLYEQQHHTPPHHNHQQPLGITANNQNNKRMKLGSYTSSQNCNCASSDFGEEEALTRTWAYKLKRLTREQRLYAEKFINDILFEAETGTLHRGSMQLNAFEPYVRFEEPAVEDERMSSVSRDKSQSPHMVTSNSPLTNDQQLPTHSSNTFNAVQNGTDVKKIEIPDKNCAATSNVENDGNRNHTASFHNYS